MTLTRVEVQMALDALGRETRVTEKLLGGKPTVCFEVDRLTRRDWVMNLSAPFRFRTARAAETAGRMEMASG
jgi:hypothetical protein